MTEKVWLMATCHQQVGHRAVQVGERFCVSPTVAAQLRRDGKASLVSGPSAAGAAGYMRRDMRAAD